MGLGVEAPRLQLGHKWTSYGTWRRAVGVMSKVSCPC